MIAAFLSYGFTDYLNGVPNYHSSFPLKFNEPLNLKKGFTFVFQSY